MPRSIYTTIETLPAASTIGLSSRLAIYQDPDSFSLYLSTTNALFDSTIKDPLSSKVETLSTDAYNAVATLMPLSGGQLTNSLILHTVQAQDDLHVVCKKYVDDADVLHIALSGDAMTGFLSAHADPNTNEEVARKQYVDDKDSLIDYIVGLNFGGFKTTRFPLSDRNQSIDNGYAGKFFVIDNTNRLKFVGSDGTLYPGGGTGTVNQRFTTCVCNIPFLSANEYAISAVGDGGFCMVLSNYGHVYTTGNNAAGQLGNASTTARYTWGVVAPSAFNYEPVQKIFMADAGAAGTAAAQTGILALTLSGSLYGWGSNDNYQLSLASNTYYTQPTRINTASNANAGSIRDVKIKDALITGNPTLAQFSVVIDENNQVHAVGNGVSTVLPFGKTVSSVSTRFSACKVVASIGATESNMYADKIYGSGSSNVYAISAGKLYAAGNNASGQLLNGFTTASKTFVPCQLANSVDSSGNAIAGRFATNIAFVKTIAGTTTTGTYTTVFVVTSAGQAFCGGYNRVASGHARQVASVSKYLKCAIPISSLAGKNIVDLKACNANFDYSVCIAKDDAYNLYAAGYNAYGAKGNGTLVTQDGFSLIIAPQNVQWVDFILQTTSIDSLDRDTHAHAYTTTGELYSWGFNVYGECGVTRQFKPNSPAINSAISVPVKTSIA